MKNEYYRKVYPPELPKKKGDYQTNFGELYFDGSKFGFAQKSMHGANFTPTIIEFWLEVEELATSKPPVIQKS